MNFDEEIEALKNACNFRSIPDGNGEGLIDLTSNDYLGLAADIGAQREFLSEHAGRASQLFTASASRLLALNQDSFRRLEDFLETVYSRKALVFNSGYHANTGIISALSAPSTLIVADKLVHASIIDGIRLGKSPFERFRHNDYNHLRRILTKNSGRYLSIMIIVESVYSMDGDMADLNQLLDIKREFPEAMLYVDEAHAVGVVGPSGLGLAASTGLLDEFDFVVGTFGKALASSGAFCLTSATIRDYLVNRARSLIFSTALPPITAEWSLKMFQKAMTMNDERNHLKRLAAKFGRAASHIIPVMTGDSERAVSLSMKLAEEGFNVLPIRTPTVPPGTERLRVSLSAALTEAQVETFKSSLTRLLNEA